MELVDSVSINQSRDVVWRALKNPDILREAIPGCEALEQVDDSHMSATVSLKIGPVRARFFGEVAFCEIDEPEGMVLTGDGKGGAAGFAKGSARVTLEEAGPAETLLTYTANVQVGGKLGQLGARLIDSTAKKLARQFFTDFNAAVSLSGEPSETAA
ncbi:CoxG family protein [Roseovarius sp. E0-M6]|uniref:CoxG family protein n=1 Tax=Roseovarius sp. E0-M6 TaxID=3127118 RepID=UPI0030101E07